MGFTIEDMMLISKDKYQMSLIAGGDGWANSISWLLMVEDMTIIQNFSGKELAVTTCLGFDTEEKLLRLVKGLHEHHASGLVINTGGYLFEIPQSIKDFCNTYHLPLMECPWNVTMSDMIKDLSIRVFLQGSTDEAIAEELIKAIENPNQVNRHDKTLLSHLDIDGSFHVVLITTDHLDEMDIVERKRLSYRLQIYLEFISHNGIFFYYDGNFVLVTNSIPTDDLRMIIDNFINKKNLYMPNRNVNIGVSSKVKDITNLHVAYDRAKAAVSMAKQRKETIIYFNEMGIYRMLYSIKDTALLDEMGEDLLKPLIEYDRLHEGEYVETLENYLRCNGSIKEAAAAMYTHRNTITYRMKGIREMLGCELETPEERLPYQIACYIRHMK